ncbi:hypothetical protein N200_02400 [Helicobacter pylori UM065]|nr:hypothetical protein N200_02400 [Helicobacter pylori UM065]
MNPFFGGFLFDKTAHSKNKTHNFSNLSSVLITNKIF